MSVNYQFMMTQFAQLISRTVFVSDEEVEAQIGLEIKVNLEYLPSECCNSSSLNFKFKLLLPHILSSGTVINCKITNTSV